MNIHVMLFSGLLMVSSIALASPGTAPPATEKPAVQADAASATPACADNDDACKRDQDCDGSADCPATGTAVPAGKMAINAKGLPGKSSSKKENQAHK